MRKLTRREIREFLLQTLYAKSVLADSYDAQEFAQSYYTAPVDQAFQDSYYQEVFAGVQEQEGVLLQIVAHYAPKFEADIMPIINLLPILIGAYEMLYLKADTIPEKVSINEAVELAKKFSDDGAREMVNGVLNKLKDDK
jgi:N utilization substance protein B